MSGPAQQKVIRFSGAAYAATVTIGAVLGLLILLFVRTQQLAGEQYVAASGMPPLSFAAEQLVGGTLIWMVIYLLALLIYTPLARLIVRFANRYDAVNVGSAALTGIVVYLPWTLLLADVSIDGSGSWLSARTLTTITLCLGAGAICGLTYLQIVVRQTSGPTRRPSTPHEVGQ